MDHGLQSDFSCECSDSIKHAVCNWHYEVAGMDYDNSGINYHIHNYRWRKYEQCNWHHLVFGKPFCHFIQFVVYQPFNALFNIGFSWFRFENLSNNQTWCFLQESWFGFRVPQSKRKRSNSKFKNLIHIYPIVCVRVTQASISLMENLACG